MRSKTAARNRPDREQGQLLIRKLNNSLKRKLRRRAERYGMSMEQLARDILYDALKDESEPQTGLGTQIANRFRGLGIREEEIRELRGYTIEPMKFEE